MSEPVRISRRRARQLAVMGQLLDAPRRRSIEEVVAEARRGPDRPDVGRRPHRAPGAVQPAGHRGSGLPSSNACCGRNVRCSSTGCTSCRSRICRCIGSRCVAIPMARGSGTPTCGTGWPPTMSSSATCWRSCAAGGRCGLATSRTARPMGWSIGGWNDEGQSVPDAARHPVVPGQGHDRRARRAAADLGPGVALAAEGAGAALGMAAELVERQVRARGVTKLDRTRATCSTATAGSRSGAPRPCRGRGVIVPIEVDGLPGCLVHAPRTARHDVPWPNRGAVAVRRPDQRPRPHRAALRHVLPHRDLCAEGQAAMGVLRVAGAARRSTGRPVRPRVRPEGERPADQRDPHAGRRATRAIETRWTRRSTSSPLVGGFGGRRALVRAGAGGVRHHPVVREPVGRERRHQLRGVAGRDPLGHQLAEDRRALEAPGAHPRHQEEPRHLGLAQQR